MFKIKANPTFQATVKIRAPGGEVQELPVVFRHKGKGETQAFFDEAKEKNKTDADCILELIESWEADAELSADSVNDLQQNYPNPAHDIFNCYLESLFLARLGN